jgi:hypothetical protein
MLFLKSTFGNKDDMKKILESGNAEDTLRWDAVRTYAPPRQEPADRTAQYSTRDVNRMLGEHPALEHDVTALLYSAYLCILHGITIPGKFLDMKGYVPCGDGVWHGSDWTRQLSWDQTAFAMDDLMLPMGVQCTWKDHGGQEQTVVFLCSTSVIEGDRHLIETGFLTEKHHYTAGAFSYDPAENLEFPKSPFLAEQEAAAAVLEAVPKFYAFRKEFYEWLDGVLGMDTKAAE